MSPTFEAVVDVTVIHPSVKLWRDIEFQARMEESKRRIEGMAPLRAFPPCLQRAETAKRKRYQPLLALMHDQFERRRSATEPELLVAGYTTFEEASKGAVRLQEGLCAAMKRKLQRRYYDDP